eukprot:m.80778 g.80778  ORF g.80778 m.80778 type:complete len:52 (-) comp12612_c0_seq3:472-627(-)
MQYVVTYTLTSFVQSLHVLAPTPDRQNTLTNTGTCVETKGVGRATVYSCNF